MFLMGRRLTGSQAHNTWDYGYYNRELEMSAVALLVSAGAFSTEVKAGSDTVGSCIVTEQLCYVYMLNLYT